ncbi:MAG: T9SS type A sorting domain-containing protein [Chitinophagales bacterium]
MKKFTPLFVIAILLIAATPSKSQINCEHDSTGMIPITDLGTDYYLGEFQGGLYPGGSNTIPTAHLNKGLNLAKKIKPLDSLGNINFVTGKIVLAGFGASTVGGPFNHLVTIMKEYNDLNPCMFAVNASNGSDGLNSMYIGNDTYWDYIEDEKIRVKGLYPLQVQAGWLMHSSRIDSNGADAGPYIDSLNKRFEVAVNAILYYYPNIKILYVSGFPYGGYADPMKAIYHVIVEPSSYHHNFAVKELIRRQMAGDPLLKFKAPGAMAPYMVWGPPLWADGMEPRAYDGLTWNCNTEFTPDGGGYHLTDMGKDKLANILLNFFRTDTLSKSWFMDGPKWVNCDPVGRYADGSIIVPEDIIVTKEDITIFPNPSTGQFYVDIDEVLTEGIKVKVLNSLGQVIYSDNYEHDGPYSGYSFNLEGHPEGIYYFEVVIGNQIITQPIVLNK